MEDGNPEPQPGTSSTELIHNCGLSIGGNLIAKNVISMTGNTFCPVPIQAQIKSPFRFNMPTPNAHYKGRRDTLKAIQKHFGNLPKKSSSCWDRMVAIVGLGGMGKTETAYKFAAKYRKKFPNVAWINAETEEIALRSFLGLAKHLGIVQQNQQSADINLVKEIYRKIDEADCGNVLFIFDNAIQLNSGAAEFGILDFLPTNDLPHGRFPNTLITTQTHDWGQRIQTFQIVELSEKESLEFFQSSFKVKSAICTTEFTKFYDLMHGYPLIMNLAVCQIDYNPNKDTILHLKEQIKKYMEEIAKENSKLTSEQISPAYGNKYDKTLSSVWKLTLERLLGVANGPEALEILQIMSFLKLPIDTDTVELILISDLDHSVPSKKERQWRLKQLIRVLDNFHIARIFNDRQKRTNGYHFGTVMHRLCQLLVRQEPNLFRVYRDDEEGYRCEVGIHRLIQLVVREETDWSGIIERILYYLIRLDDCNLEGGVQTSILFKEISKKFEIGLRALTFLGILAFRNSAACKIFEIREPKTGPAATLWCSYNLIGGNSSSIDNVVGVLVELLTLINSPEWPKIRRFFADITMRILRLPSPFKLADELRCLECIKVLFAESLWKNCSCDDLQAGFLDQLREKLDEKLFDILSWISQEFIQSNATRPQAVVKRLTDTLLAALGRLNNLNADNKKGKPTYWIRFWNKLDAIINWPDANQLRIAELVRCLWDRGLAAELIQAVKYIGLGVDSRSIECFVYQNEYFLIGASLSDKPVYDVICSIKSFISCYEAFLKGKSLKDKCVQDVMSEFFDTTAKLISNEELATHFEYRYIYTACSVWIQLLLMDGGPPAESLHRSWSPIGARIRIIGTCKYSPQELIKSFREFSKFAPDQYFRVYYPQFLLKSLPTKDQETREEIIFCRQMMQTYRAEEVNRGLYLLTSSPWRLADPKLYDVITVFIVDEDSHKSDLFEKWQYLSCRSLTFASVDDIEEHVGLIALEICGLQNPVYYAKSSKGWDLRFKTVTYLILRLIKRVIQKDAPELKSVMVTQLASMSIAYLAKLRDFEPFRGNNWNCFWCEIYKLFESADASPLKTAELRTCLWDDGLAQELIYVIELYGSPFHLFEEDLVLPECIYASVSGMDVIDVRAQQVISAFNEMARRCYLKWDLHWASASIECQNLRIARIACFVWIKMLLMDDDPTSKNFLQGLSRCAALNWLGSIEAGYIPFDIAHDWFKLSWMRCNGLIREKCVEEYFPQLIQRYSSSNIKQIKWIVTFCKLILEPDMGSVTSYLECRRGENWRAEQGRIWDARIRFGL